MQQMSEDVIEDIENLILDMVTAIVDFPDDVKVDKIVGGINTVVFALHVNKTDVGKVIGKSGRNAVALRTFVNALAAKHGIRALVDLANNPKRSINEQLLGD